MQSERQGYWTRIWQQFLHHPLGVIGLVVSLLFCFVGVYAPLLASSKPLVVEYGGRWYFPLFRYLFYNGFFTKRLDLFFNLLIFTLPLALAALLLLKRRPKLCNAFLGLLLIVQVVLFAYFAYVGIKDPAVDLALNKARVENKPKLPDWNFDLRHMNDYARLNLVVDYILLKQQHHSLSVNAREYGQAAMERLLDDQVRLKKQAWLKENRGTSATMPSDDAIRSEILQEMSKETRELATAVPSLWQRQQANDAKEIERLEKVKDKSSYARAKLQYLLQRQQWLEEQSKQVHHLVVPLVRLYHWEDDAGGEQQLNKYVSWWDLTRINRKDLTAALIFGVRISLVVGIISVALSLIIGVPIGAFSGFYGGTFDIITCRLLEIWESMPTFLMLLMVVAMTQSKSIFIVISVIGLFGWTTFSRYIRGEFFKQRNLSYVEACRCLGFSNNYTIFTHILPNAIPPLLTLLPFAIMAAITSEAALSFLGLGEEGSCSWGVLMDEGRSAFPAESYLLWPPAILLTLLLVAIALVGDAMRDALDPKLRR